MRVTRPARLLAAPVLLGALALTGCSDASGRVAPAAVDEPIRSGVAPASAPSVPGSVVSTGLAPDVEVPQYGVTYGAVVIAASGSAYGSSDAESADLDAADARAEQLGYTAYTAEVGCVPGTAEAFDLADGTLISHLLFADLTDARQFADAYTERTGADVVGVTTVEAACLD